MNKNNSLKKCAFCGDSLASRHNATKYCSYECSGKANYKGKKKIHILPVPKGFKLPKKRKNRKDVMKLKKFLNTYKLKVGCVDCGYKNDSVALEFDHIPSRGKKRFELRNAPDFKEAMEEMLLCEVRCCNCHRIKTRERMIRKQMELFD